MNHKITFNQYLDDSEREYIESKLANEFREYLLNRGIDIDNYEFEYFGLDSDGELYYKLVEIEEKL